MSSKGRRQGHALERVVATDLRNILPDRTIGTTRQHSRELDAKKVDIFIEPNPDELYIQCKKRVMKTKTPTIDTTVLAEMPEGVRCLVTKITKHAGTRESSVGVYVTMPYEEWLRIMARAYGNRNSSILGGAPTSSALQSTKKKATGKDLGTEESNGVRDASRGSRGRRTNTGREGEQHIPVQVRGLLSKKRKKVLPETGLNHEPE